MSKKIIPIILCGGTGTRLWPLSRDSFPKQYIPLIQGSKNSMLQMTYKRLIGLENLCEPILVCNEEHRFIVAEQLREIDIRAKSILLEPFGKNTAPAITIAALKALEFEANPTLLILSSDHQISDPVGFRKSIEMGIVHASNNKLVVFGLTPSEPESGYGYIESEEPLKENNLEFSKINKFIEKPNNKLAKKLIKDKRYLWNSGIFLFKAKTILKEIEKFSPDIVKFCSESIKERESNFDFQRIDKVSFNKCPNISIDYAVMEKTKLGTVVFLNTGWSDLGTWNALWNNSKKNSKGNFTQGNIILRNSKNCFLKGENRLIVGLGLNNIIAIETRDAILISDQNESQNIKNIVKELKEKKKLEGTEHLKIYRPWGYYISIATEKFWKVKEIYLKPNSSISLQMHNYRSEHWVVVKGNAKVQIGENITLLKKNESVFVPAKTKHKLSNITKKGLAIIEIQSGSYLGEDDIVRYEDLYGRI